MQQRDRIKTCPYCHKINRKLSFRYIRHVYLEQVDGAVSSSHDQMVQLGKRKGGDIAAIFVHAGAGYHSLHNEKNHLKACEDACTAAMAFLKNGSSAVDAVEMALKVLEDNEITNAGFGSNLTEEGYVEGDACIVDHCGRSGAVGAIRSVANPIHVARIVFDESHKPLSLRRVPPNLLVGEGATEFAFQHGVPILPNEIIVSPASKERWLRWKKDLENVKESGEESAESSTVHIADPSTGTERSISLDSREFASLNNDSQPISPMPNPDTKAESSWLVLNTPGQPQGLTPSSAGVVFSRPSPLNPAHSVYQDSGIRAPQHSHTHTHPIRKGDHHISELDDEKAHADQNPPIRRANMQPQLNSDFFISQNDLVTDTVGAIAIDCHGNIAAASSSGGIGMKRRGRIGPAALVGIGTTVIPCVADDKGKTAVAVVTSGTGEHMATTNAAHMCAYNLSRNTPYWEEKGKFTDEADDEIIKNFIDVEFMNHPSVQESSHIGAIGIMAVKKSVDGIWLHFAHNTSSFALASMSSEDEVPRTVMSRAAKNTNNCTLGGLAYRYQERETKRRKKDDKSQHKLGKKMRSPPPPPPPSAVA